jgi:S-DNA-T family DNA segregation ATPase FtsK/SpoIIIE
MAKVKGKEVGTGPVNFRSPTVAIRLRWVVLWFCLRALGRGIGYLVRHPGIVATTTVGVQCYRLWTSGSAWIVIASVAALGLVLGGWRWQWPDSFARRVVWRIRGSRRRFMEYRTRWDTTMRALKLTVRMDDRTYVPRIIKVRSSGTVDQVTVRLLPGQILTDYAEQSERLARTFGAEDCRVRSAASLVPSWWPGGTEGWMGRYFSWVLPRRTDRLVLWFLTNDPLREIVAPIPATDPPNLQALDVARREDGLMFRLRLLYTHLLVAGATGAGKGSVLWSIIAALGPGIQSGLVQLWVLDPKGGMELALGRRLFHRFCYGSDPAMDGATDAEYEEAFATLLEDLVVIMRRRQGKLRGLSRLLKPSLDEPFIVLIADELASLTAYVTDPAMKKRIAKAFSLLLSQGRAVGISVVGALQDPRKEVLPFRDLFPTRLALRMSEGEQVKLVLTDGARERGARCDKIPESLPGVGYVTVDGETEPVRVRFSHITDEAIEDLVNTYAPDLSGPTGHISVSTLEGASA